ncbi:MAG: MFS transporter [Chloroflexi bacterium]|nr:MFS transporter [Chloroflexota bacterium]
MDRPADSIPLTDALNEAPLSIFHLRAMFTSGMGFFTDAYDLFIIGVALTLVKAEWHLSTSEATLASSVALLGAVVGAFVFGRLADLLGRKAIYGLEAAVMAIAAIASAFAPNIAWLIAARFLLGIGIGGDYPVSATIMSEYANRRDRGRLVSMVFSTQAAGLIVGPVVGLTLLAAGVQADLAWRLMLGLGAVPALAVIYLRRTLPESPRYRARVRGDATGAAASLAAYTGGQIQGVAVTEPRIHERLRDFLSNPRNLLLLLGTAGSWFLLDYAFYGNTISTTLILSSVAPHAALIQSVAWSLVIFALAAAPGYVLAIATIDRIGHRRLQWIGFLGMAAAFATIGLVPNLTHVVLPFLVIYGISYFFTEFGPNVTTFVLPSEVFPVTSRTTGHGIASGIAKIGAFVGVYAFPHLASALGLHVTLLFTAGVAVAGALLTLVLPEPAGLTIEEASREDLVISRISRPETVTA